jgi:hypothetical protein
MARNCEYNRSNKKIENHFPGGDSMTTKPSVTTRKPVAAGKEVLAPKSSVEKKAAPAAKVTPVTKVNPPTTATPKVKKRDVFHCETCGLSVVVDECGEIVATPNFVCCEKIMAYQPAKAKDAKKKAKDAKKKVKGAKKKANVKGAKKKAK